jgi:hypothetical protein
MQTRSLRLRIIEHATQLGGVVIQPVVDSRRRQYFQVDMVAIHFAQPAFHVPRRQRRLRPVGKQRPVRLGLG